MYYLLKKKGTFVMSEGSSLEKKHDGISHSVLEFGREYLVSSSLSVS
jgi:hypothetical protein